MDVSEPDMAEADTSANDISKSPTLRNDCSPR
jgi:hypothetical protein